MARKTSASSASAPESATAAPRTPAVPDDAATWNTKYGTRRVRKDPPTLDQAIFAAKGLSDDLAEQAEIAAALMGLPLDDVKKAVARAGRTVMTTTTHLVRDTPSGANRAPQRAVVVERKISRKIVRTGPMR